MHTTDLSEAVAVEVPAAKAAEATRALRADPNVAYVEPDHVAYAAAIRPDDPGYAGQWGIAMARVNQAWSATKGASRVTVRRGRAILRHLVGHAVRGRGGGLLASPPARPVRDRPRHRRVRHRPPR